MAQVTGSPHGSHRPFSGIWFNVTMRRMRPVLVAAGTVVAGLGLATTGGRELLRRAGDFAKAVGLTMDGSKFGMGTRGQRYSMLVRDGVVEQLNVEQPGEFKVSSAEAVLQALGLAHRHAHIEVAFRYRVGGADQVGPAVTGAYDRIDIRGVGGQSLREKWADGPVTFYCGFDPTAPSLHVGHLVQVLTLRHDETNTFVWSESFELRLTNWFGTQRRLIRLITTALNDDRAPAWNAMKLTAALQAAQGQARTPKGTLRKERERKRDREWRTRRR